jgi:phosphate transport system ATP-binding protein
MEVTEDETGVPNDLTDEPGEGPGLEPAGHPGPSGGLEVADLNAWFGPLHALRNITVSMEPRSVSAIMGPSGCGKSTFIRCLNRMHEEVRGARVEGKVVWDGTDIYGPDADPVGIRRRVGMVFQKPNPFPTMTVLDNAVAGLKLFGGMSKAELKERGEAALRAAGLWGEVKDRLDRPGGRLSGGQQQRLCIARALAVEPEIILMDEPCSALDPASTLRIEELIA